MRKKKHFTHSLKESLPDQKVIVSAPDDSLNLIKFELRNDSTGEIIEIQALANLKQNEIDPVAQNWLARTTELSSHSFVNYINSKADYGFKAQMI